MEKLEDKFTAWYSLAVPKFDSDQLKARLQTVSELKQALVEKDVPQLVREFYRLPSNGAYAETMRKALAKDTKYIPKNDDAELAVIAGAVIYSTLAKPSNVADALSLAVFCTEAGGMRVSERVDDVVAGCDEYLRVESIRVREESEGIPALSVDTFTTAVKGLQAHYPAGVPAYGAALDEALTKFATSLKTYSTSVGSYIKTMENHRNEESDILYWILGESTVEGDRYSGMDTKKASILVASDLAQITQFLPGPTSASSLMRKMLRLAAGDNDPHLTISECVDSLEKSRREALAANFSPHDAVLMPILFAFSKAVESGGQGWTSAFSTQTLLEPDKKLRASSIADQLYSELLLRRALS